MTAQSDLQLLLRDLSPELLPGEFVYVTTPQFPHVLESPSPCLATIQEPEGLTLILERRDAQTHGFPADLVFRRIILRVHSSLGAVGLTAAVSSALAEAGISANMLAGYHHDQILVPAADAARALEVLQSLSPPPGD